MTTSTRPVTPNTAVSLRAISVRVGDRIEYIGPTTSRPSLNQVLKAGDIGTVTLVDPVDPPNPCLVVDEDAQETYPGRDGCALVAWPNHKPGLIWPDGEGIRWRRVTSRKLVLSPAQKALLLRLSTSKNGFETRPEGYHRASGPLASSWQRTAKSLAARALVSVTSHGAQITDAGRAVVVDLTSRGDS